MRVSFVQWSSSSCVSSRLGVASWVISVSEAGLSFWPLTSIVVFQHYATTLLSPFAPTSTLSSPHESLPNKRPKSIWSTGSSTSANLLLCMIFQSFVWLTDYTVCVTVCWLCLPSPPAVRWMMEIIFIRWKSGQASHLMFFFFPGLLWSQSFLESGWVLHSASFRSVSLEGTCFRS